LNRTSWTVCLAVLLAGCGSGGSLRADSRPGLSSLSRGDLPDGSGQVLWYRNRHTYPVRIVSVSLLDCVNLRGGCVRDMPHDALVYPGQTYEVMTVYAADPSQPFSFRWTVGSRRVQ